MSTQNDRRYNGDDILLMLASPQGRQNTDAFALTNFEQSSFVQNPTTGSVVGDDSIDAEINKTLLGGLSTGCTICDITLYGGLAFLVAFMLAKM